MPKCMCPISANAEEISMPSPQTSSWWSTFLTEHGNSSEEEAAFLGYLTTHAIDPGAEPDVLSSAYTAFHDWMTASYAAEGTDPVDAQAAAAQAATVPPAPP